MLPVTTRWRVPIWAWPIIALAIAAEAGWNALRAYELGTHLDRLTVTLTILQRSVAVSLGGWVLVLAAVAVSMAQPRAAWISLFGTGPARQRVLAGLAAVLLLSISISAGASHLLEAHRLKDSDQGGERAAYDDLRLEYERKDAELSALGKPRPVSVIQADVNAVRIDPTIWRRSAQCSDVTEPDSKRACQPVLELYKERGNAAKKAELEPDVTNLRARLAAMKRPNEAHWGEVFVANFWSVAMGLGIVLLATFGPVLFAVAVPAAAAPTEPARNSSSVPRGTPDPAGPPHGKRRRRLLDNVVPLRQRQVIETLERVGGSVNSNRELAALMQCSEGEASKRVDRVRHLLHLETVGKEVRITLRQQRASG